MSGGNWSDLKARVLSALVMAVVGFVCLALGGLFSVMLVASLCGVIIWEASRMIEPASRDHVKRGAMGFVAILLCWIGGPYLLLPVIIASAIVIVQPMRNDQGLLGGWVIAILLSGYAFLWMRLSLGFDAILWLIGIIILSDVGGYFAGRSLGGPKFWPRFSPKKTWSGTIAGWLAAGVFGAVMMPVLHVGWWLIPMSMLVAFAGQMGDIAESALKRQTGVKDSSQLIPGHGGVWDRFDAMLGGALLAWILCIIGLVPVAG